MRATWKGYPNQQAAKHHARAETTTDHADLDISSCALPARTNPAQPCMGMGTGTCQQGGSSTTAGPVTHVGKQLPGSLFHLVFLLRTWLQWSDSDTFTCSVQRRRAGTGAGTRAG